ALERRPPRAPRRGEEARSVGAGSAPSVAPRVGRVGQVQPAYPPMDVARRHPGPRHSRRPATSRERARRVVLRVTVAGTGPRGCQWAREVQASRSWELSACADVDPAALEEAVSSLGLAADRCLPTLAEALDARPCDVVVVATTSSDHASPCQETLSRGLATLVEKPFAHDLASARALVDMAERQGVPLVVGQNLRYTRAHRAVRR